MPVDQRTADFTDPAALRRLADLQPDVIVNCAACTDVDGAEADASTCWTINAEAPAVLAELGACLIHISTDYVFDDTARTPYREDAPLSGLGVYGRSKAAGEQAVRERGGTVVRTAWLCGPGPRNFVARMLRLASSGGRYGSRTTRWGSQRTPSTWPRGSSRCSSARCRWRPTMRRTAGRPRGTGSRSRSCGCGGCRFRSNP